MHGSTDCGLMGHAIWLSWVDSEVDSWVAVLLVDLIVFGHGQLATPSFVICLSK